MSPVFVPASPIISDGYVANITPVLTPGTYQPLTLNTSGSLNVAVQSGSSTGVDGYVTDTVQNYTTGTYQPIIIDGQGHLQVDIQDFADSAIISPFGRLSINEAVAIFTSQQQYGDDTTIWESAFVGTGANTFLPHESTIQMTTGGTGSTASCIRQSRIYHRYTPGHGTTIICSFAMDGGNTITNNTRRIGFFDANNGIFLEVAGTTVSLVLRTNTTGTPSDTNRVAQASWNVDKFDGNGPSGITINWATTQILIADLQWLGVGRVRVGFDINGTLYAAHYFNNANNLTKVYMTSANLPIRLENFNTGTASGTATLRHICNSVVTDGGVEPSFGKLYCYNNGVAGLAITNGTRVPIISVRAGTTGPNSVRNTGQISIGQYDMSSIGSNILFWELVLNGTLGSGTSFANYNSSNSIAQVDSTSTTISGGTILDAGILSGSATNHPEIANQPDIKTLILVYSSLLNNQDTITLVGTASGTGVIAFANFGWLESF